jgi:hypothetical protein
MRNFCLAALGILCITASAGLVVAIRDEHRTAGEIQSTVAEIKMTATAWREYSEEQTGQLRSPRTQRAIEAAIEVGATAKASLLLVNTQLLPRTWKTVDSLREATGRISDLTAHTDAQLNQQVMPGFADLIHNSIKLENQLGIDAKELGDAITLTSQQTGLSLQEIQKRIADPRFDAILDSLAGSAGHLNGTSAEVEAASRRFPEIADSLARISKTTSRFSKAYWVARILSIVVPLVP